VTDNRGRSASYELPDEVGRKFAKSCGDIRGMYEDWTNGARIDGAARLAVIGVFKEKPPCLACQREDAGGPRG